MKFAHVQINPKGTEGLYEVRGLENAAPAKPGGGTAYEHYYKGLCVPTDATYKELLEATMDFFSSTVSGSGGGLSRNEKEYNSPLNEQDINLKFVNFLQNFGSAMQYFLNSTSWREQELQDFDRFELISRFEKAIRELR